MTKVIVLYGLCCMQFFVSQGFTYLIKSWKYTRTLDQKCIPIRLGKNLIM